MMLMQARSNFYYHIIVRRVQSKSYWSEQAFKQSITMQIL